MDTTQSPPQSPRREDRLLATLRRLPRLLRPLVLELGVRRRLRRARAAGRTSVAELTAAAFGLDELDLVHYETVAEYESASALIRAIFAEGVPFRTHAQWCRALRDENQGACDCDADWQAYLGGELTGFSAPVAG